MTEKRGKTLYLTAYEQLLSENFSCDAARELAARHALLVYDEDFAAREAQVADLLETIEGLISERAILDRVLEQAWAGDGRGAVDVADLCRENRGLLTHAWMVQRALEGDIDRRLRDAQDDWESDHWNCAQDDTVTERMIMAMPAAKPVGDRDTWRV